MAQDLHDGVGHGLAVIAMQAGVALHVLDRDPAKARESLRAIRETSRESLDALRAELSRLSTDPAAMATRAVHGLDDLPGLVGARARRRARRSICGAATARCPTMWRRRRTSSCRRR